MTAIFTRLTATFTFVALILSLTGCIDENVPPDDNNANDDRLMSISIGHESATRRVGNPVTDRSTVAFNGGILYLVDVNGRIVRHYTITADLTDINMGGNNIDIATVRDGDPVIIPNVPARVRQVVIAGNTLVALTAPAGEQISEVGEQPLGVLTQWNEENVNLWGSADIDPANFTVAGEQRQYNIEISLAPTVARIEIADITGGATIHSFRVQGVFIDNFHLNSRIDGIIDAAAANLINGGTTAANFNLGAGHYTATSNYALFDWNAQGWQSTTGTSPVARPSGTGTVWAYQLFANHPETAQAQRRSVFPRIVFRLTDVEVNDPAAPGGRRTLPGTQFLTVAGFGRVVSGGGNPVPINYLTAANVYHIGEGAIVFNENDLDIVPNRRTITGRITITVAHWNHRGGAGGIRPPLQFRQPNPLAYRILSGETHTFTPGRATGYSGSVTYEWQSSPTGTEGTWTVVREFSDDPNFETAPLTENTYFRRIARDGAYNIIVSEKALIRVIDGVVIDNLIWARSNVGASQPHESGYFFQWNSNVRWLSTGDTPVSNPPGATWQPVDNLGGINATWRGPAPENTAHQGPCPPGWRLPTQVELQNLNSQRRTWGTWDTLGGRSGAWFGPAGTPNANTHVFLPAAGWRDTTGGLLFVGANGHVWSSTPSGTDNAVALHFNSGSSGTFTYNRAIGFSVRCVRNID